MEGSTIRWRTTTGDAFAQLRAYSPGPFYVIPILGGLLVAVAIWNLVAGDASWIGWLMLAAIPAISWFWLVRRVRSQLGIEVVVSCREDGLLIDQGATHTTIDWAGVTGVRARGGVVEVLHHNQVVVWLPRRVFANLAELKSFADEIRLRVAPA